MFYNSGIHMWTKSEWISKGTDAAFQKRPGLAIIIQFDLLTEAT